MKSKTWQRIRGTRYQINVRTGRIRKVAVESSGRRGKVPGEVAPLCSESLVYRSAEQRKIKGGKRV